MRLRQAAFEQRMGTPNARVAGECDFLAWREDAHAIIGFASGRREQERGLHEVVPARKALHRGTAPLLGIEHHTKVITAPTTGGKHIKMQVTYTRHDDAHSLKLRDGSCVCCSRLMAIVTSVCLSAERRAPCQGVRGR